jgi:TolB-like protein
MTESNAGGTVGGSNAPSFISYASHDAAAAEKVCAALEVAGLPCWMAPRNVRAGESYAAAIVEAITSCRMLVLLLSRAAINSPHVLREVERASSKRRPILSIRMDRSELPPDLEYFLSTNQWLDASGGLIEEVLPAAVASVRHHGESNADSPVHGATRAKPGSVQVSKSPPGVDNSSSPWRNRATTLALVLAAGVLGYFLVHKFRPTGPVAAEQATTAAMHVASDRSIAVLPFADMSEKRDQEYFADGIAEEILDRLAKVPGLRVVGRASSFQFKAKSADPASIGAALGVAYLLEGSVRKDSGRVRVTAQLVQARTGSQRWADSFDSELLDVLSVQDNIAIEIARALELTVEVDTAPRPSIKSPEALEAYLRGLQSEDRQSRESSEAAVVDFQRALSLDATFAQAAIGLARTYAFIGAEGWLPTRVAFERAREAALLAQRLDPKGATPHVLMAQIHTNYDWDWAAASRELQQAFALGPRDSHGALVAAQLAAALGQVDEARQLGIESVELDPLNPFGYFVLGWSIYFHTGQYAEAEKAIRRGLQIAPKWGAGQYFLGQALLLQGHNDAALAEFKKETLDDGQLEGSAMAHFAAGRRVASDAQLAAAIRQNGTSWPSEIARVYAFRGEKDHAFEWLDRAYDLRDEDLFLIKNDPLFRNLLDDPRYKAFLRKMNLPE